MFAKRLRDFVLVLYPGYRAVQCDMMEVRLESKKNIDRMYFLRSEETQGWVNIKYHCEITENLFLDFIQVWTIISARSAPVGLIVSPQKLSLISKSTSSLII